MITTTATIEPMKSLVRLRYWDLITFSTGGQHQRTLRSAAVSLALLPPTPTKPLLAKAVNGFKFHVLRLGMIV